MRTPGSVTTTRFNAVFGEPLPGLGPSQMAKGRVALGWLAFFGGLAGFGYRFVPGVLSSGAASTVYAVCMVIIAAVGIGLLLFEPLAQELACGLLVVANVAIGASVLAFTDSRAFANPLILVIPLLFSAGLLARPWFILQCVATMVILLLIPPHIYASTPAWLSQLGWNTFALLLSALGVRFLRRQALDALARSERLSNTDFLTGLSNRRDVDRRAGSMVRSARQTNRMVVAAVLDLDHFKSINDSYGHDVGDQVLVQVAHAVRSHAGEEDVVARTGGEEILVLSIAGVTEQATALGDQLVGAVAAIEVGTPVGPVRPSCSVGVAVASPAAAPNDDHWLWRLVFRADSALLQAKRSGRGRCVLDSSPHTQSPQHLNHEPPAHHEPPEHVVTRTRAAASPARRASNERPHRLRT